MKHITFLFLFIAQISFAQNQSINQIIDNLEIEGDTIHAVYDWVTNNVKYDVNKAKKIENGVNFYKQGNYKSIADYKAYLLKTVIKKKQGVCDDYTLLFDAIVSELGYDSYIVIGITKRKDGKVNKDIGHSWNVVKINNEWKLYDPTWGAGYIKDNKKFIKKYSKKWYNVDPSVMLEDHFPFDPIWQLSNTPINFKEFEKNKQPESDTLFDFKGLIDEYLQKEEKDRIVDELSRMEENGGNIEPIKRRKVFLQNKININRTNNTVPAIIEECKAATNLFNQYISNGKNKKFEDSKWTIAYSSEQLSLAQSQLKQAIKSLKKVETKDSKAKKSLKKILSQTKKILETVENEIKWIKGKM